MYYYNTTCITSIFPCESFKTTRWNCFRGDKNGKKSFDKP